MRHFIVEKFWKFLGFFGFGRMTEEHHKIWPESYRHENSSDNPVVPRPPRKPRS